MIFRWEFYSRIFIFIMFFWVKTTIVIANYVTVDFYNNPNDL